MVKPVALVGLLAAAAASGSQAAIRATGTLTGTTQITFGCPGPVSPTGPCYPWHAFPNARFSIARRAADGSPVPATAVLARSNAHARFSIRLAAGLYVITPLPQRNTHGGARIVVRVRAGLATTTRVRFQGFPLME
jgi:hypothetical protein